MKINDHTATVQISNWPLSHIICLSHEGKMQKYTSCMINNGWVRYPVDSVNKMISCVIAKNQYPPSILWTLKRCKISQNGRTKVQVNATYVQNATTYENNVSDLVRFPGNPHSLPHSGPNCFSCHQTSSIKVRSRELEKATRNTRRTTAVGFHFYACGMWLRPAEHIRKHVREAHWKLPCGNLHVLLCRDASDVCTFDGGDRNPVQGVNKLLPKQNSRTQQALQ